MGVRRQPGIYPGKHVRKGGPKTLISYCISTRKARNSWMQSGSVQILKKFCRFLPGHRSGVEGQQINNPTPAWTKRPSELTPQDYQDFYKELYPYSEAPLFWIHLNVDYPFNLTGILYFPRIKQSYEIQKDKIQLVQQPGFCNGRGEGYRARVPDICCIASSVRPRYPAECKRAAICGGDPNVKKINNPRITKEGLPINWRKSSIRSGRRFEEKWDSLGLFVKYGMMTDDKLPREGHKVPHYGRCG